MSKQLQDKSVKPGGDVFSAAASSQASVQAAFPESTVSYHRIDEDAVTIGEALEATALVLGDKPVDHADAAAVVAAEMRATGLVGVVPGGVGAAALAAAESNSQNEKKSKQEKTSISDVLEHSSAVLPANKVVTREDAVSIRSAEEQSRWARDGKDTGFGVASTVMEAAEINEDGVF
ncbi:late embryogenesis abundant protein 3-like [Carex rostrata]